jgi:sugar phosphate isomerase/epimerase
MFELGAHTLPYRAYPFERALEGIARVGFRFVGVWNDHAGSPVVPPEAGAAAIDAVRRRIEAHGLVPRMAFRFPGAESGAAAQMRRSIEVAAALGDAVSHLRRPVAVRRPHVRPAEARHALPP